MDRDIRVPLRTLSRTTSPESNGLIVATGWPTSSWAPVRAYLERSGFAPVDSPGQGGSDNLLVGFCRPRGDDPLSLQLTIQRLTNDLPRPIDNHDTQVLAHWAATQRDTTFLIFFSRFQDALARALERDEDPEEFCTDWRDANLAMLQFRRLNRARCLVFDCESVMRDGRGFEQICAGKGLDISFAHSDRAALLAPPPPRALDSLVAEALRASHPELARIDAELDATAFPLAEGNYQTLPSAGALTQDLRSRKDARDKERARFESQARSLKNLTVELEEQRQSHLSARAALQRDAEAQHKRLAANVENLEQALQEAKSKHSELSEENALLLSQLHSVQEELEKVFLASQSTEQRLEESRREIENLSEELKGQRELLSKTKQQAEAQTAEKQKQLEQANQAKASAEKTAAEQKTQLEQLTQAKQQAEAQAGEIQKQLELTIQARDKSEKLAQELKAQATQLEQRAIKSERERDDAADENELMLNQLHIVQEELESYFLKHQAAEARASELERKIQEIRQRSERRANLASEFDARAKRLAGRGSKLAEQINALETQLHSAQNAAEHSRLQRDELSAALQRALTQNDHALRKLTTSSRLLSLPARLKLALRAAHVDWRFRGRRKLPGVDRTVRRLLVSTPLFDAEWYLKRYPDVAEAGVHPVDHFLLFGGPENRDPSPAFNTYAYAVTNALTGREVNPLLHYLLLNPETES